jgi:hypothetical protein
MATETKQSNLEKAFERKNALNLNLTTEQFIELNGILYDLASLQHSKGMADATEIYTKYYNL